MNKLYNDPNLPTKKWTIYVPKDQYKALKNHSTINEENINENISEAFSTYIKLMPILKTLRKEAAGLNLPLDEYIHKLLVERDN